MFQLNDSLNSPELEKSFNEKLTNNCISTRSTNEHLDKIAVKIDICLTFY